MVHRRARFRAPLQRRLGRRSHVYRQRNNRTRAFSTAFQRQIDIPGRRSFSEGGQAPIRMLHLAFRADRKTFLAAQAELKRRRIDFEFQDHEISHSIYFRDPDGHELEITTYELK